jgi:hypothetical protein
MKIQMLQGSCSQIPSKCIIHNARCFQQHQIFIRLTYTVYCRSTIGLHLFYFLYNTDRYNCLLQKKSKLKSKISPLHLLPNRCQKLFSVLMAVTMQTAFIHGLSLCSYTPNDCSWQQLLRMHAGEILWKEGELIIFVIIFILLILELSFQNIRAASMKMAVF